jgi:hypothetical protein
MQKNQVIGVSGVAGSGKDLFSSAVEQELVLKGFKVKRISLAAALKSEVRRWCFENYGIDSIDCSREDKEKIRDFLVFHGTTKRNASGGRHWIDIIDSIIRMEKDNYDYFIISDVRYDDYEKDEVYWLKEELKGVLVHVQLYWVEQRLNGHKKVFQQPVNSEEARNDPKLLKKCNYDVTWEMFSDINKDKYTKEYAVKFVEWLTLGNGV